MRPSHCSPTFCNTRADAWLSGWHVALIRASFNSSKPNRTMVSAASVAYPLDQNARLKTYPEDAFVLAVYLDGY
jgi:hypothetical protein